MTKVRPIIEVSLPSFRHSNKLKVGSVDVKMWEVCWIVDMKNRRSCYLFEVIPGRMQHLQQHASNKYIYTVTLTCHVSIFYKGNGKW